MEPILDLSLFLVGDLCLYKLPKRWKFTCTTPYHEGTVKRKRKNSLLHFKLLGERELSFARLEEESVIGFKERGVKTEAILLLWESDVG